MLATLLLTLVPTGHDFDIRLYADQREAVGGEAFHVLIEVSNSRSERLFLADRGRGYAWSFEATQGEES